MKRVVLMMFTMIMMRMMRVTVSLSSGILVRS